MTKSTKKSAPKTPQPQPGFTESESTLMQHLDAKKKSTHAPKVAENGAKVGKMFKKKKINQLENEDEEEAPAIKKPKLMKSKPAVDENAMETEDAEPVKPSKKKTVKISIDTADDLKGFALQVPKKKENSAPKIVKEGLAANNPDPKKEMKEKAKSLKVERKKKGNENKYDLSVKAKQIWEELRREDTGKDRQLSLSAELYGIVKGHTSELVFAHDTARVIECLFGSAALEIRQALFNELKSHTINLAKSQYAHFYLIKVLRSGVKEQRDHIIQSLSGKVVELMKHKIASKVVEIAYNDWANASQRALLVQEFYGPEFKVFKDKGITTLAGALEKFPEKKGVFLKHMSSAIAPIIAKGVFNHSLLHRLTYEYLTHCDVKERAEMITNLREAVVQVLHTRDGARIGMICIWHGNGKDRKAIIKSFKGFVTKVCQEEHGHSVLHAIFDSVDDTKYVFKAIISEMASNWKDILFHENGRKVALYLLAGRDKIYTHPQVIEHLVKGDGNEFSKKTYEVRHKELVELASPLFLDAIVAEPETWLKESSHCLVMGAILKCSVGPGLEAAFQAVASVIGQPMDQDLRNALSSEEDKIQHWVEQSAVHMILKMLIKYDKMREQPPYFSMVVLENIEPEVVKGWLSCNRAAFLLVYMFETDIACIKEAVADKVKNLRKYLQKQNNKGADLLDSKLSNFA